MVMIIRDILIEEEFVNLRKDLENWNDYIPLLLLNFVDRRKYFNNCTSTARAKYKEVRYNQPHKNKKEYLKQDLVNWVKENQQFEYILK